VSLRAISVLRFAFPVLLSAISVLHAETEKVDFARDVEPIFKKSCLACHGSKKQLGQLRLDAASAAMHGGLSGKSIVPKDVENSEVYRRVAGIGEQARMPMGSKLADKDIATIKRWIEEGAVWPESGSVKVESKKHWAFEPPVKSALPEVKNTVWAKTPIDRFILSRLEKEGLAPSEQADKITLLRRASLDLIGLPPTIAEVDAFLADKSPNAYEKQVDRLLASPHFGERWARVWLDAARYADSDGFEKDKQRFVHFYRDWVVKAFNQDKSYRDFIREQLAGDLLPNPTQEQLVATGFLRNSMINEEGGIDPEQFRMEAMFDRMDAVGKSMLGLTIGCAQCHNHKFDPLKQEEYYSMLAVLNNSHEGSLPVYTSEQQMLRADLFQKIRMLEDDLLHRTPDWKERLLAWEKGLKKQPTWIVPKFTVDDMSTGGARYIELKDGSWLQGGYAPTKHRAWFSGKTDLENMTAVQLELLNDPNLPMNGPGRAADGMGALTEIEVVVTPPNEPVDSKNRTTVKFIRATADVNPPMEEVASQYEDKSKECRFNGPVSYAIDGKKTTSWSIKADPGRRNQPRKAVFVAEKPFGLPGGSMLHIYLRQDAGGWNSDDNQNYNLGRMRLSVTTAADAEADLLPARVREAINLDPAKRTDAQWRNIFQYWRTTQSEFAALNKEIEALWAQHPEPSSQLVMREREDMRSTSVLFRGDFLKPLKPVSMGVPAFLNKAPNGKIDRLAFADWMTDSKAPTTARSIVNRVWQSYFGTGIVATSEDLGMQSDAPSHKELLDFLSVDLMENNWSLKRLHRSIVTSETYKQSSKVSEDLYSKDPYNRLLARGARFRVEAEIVRDIALSSSGLLNAKMGGPSVYPPAPEFLFLPPASYGPKPWYEAKGDDRYRRALYTFRYRSVPYPMLQTYDAPNGDAACVRRSRSNTPLQALVSLNEPVFMESAQALGLKTVSEGGKSRDQRLNYAFRRVLSRPPSVGEKTELLALFDKQLKKFSAKDAKVHEFAGLKPNAPTKGVPPAEVAAWTAVSRVLLNLDEAISKE
jgi:mono/diheme cytochrome c family protein